jgi:hypothetical protein
MGDVEIVAHIASQRVTLRRRVDLATLAVEWLYLS